MPSIPDNMIRPGQRWFSSAEPELGLGTVLRLAGRQVQLVFTGSGTLRNYAIAAGPLLRAAFRPGDRVRVDGIGRVVERLEERDGLIHYWCGADCIAEGQLDECNITLRDLQLIAASFKATLRAVYHPRVQYPSPTSDEIATLARGETPAVGRS